MAKYLTPPDTLEKADKGFLRTLITATEQVFPKDLGLEGEANRPLNEWYKTPDGLYQWKVGDLLAYVTDLTDTNDIRSANRVLYQTLSKVPEYTAPTFTGAPESPVSANRPDIISLKEKQEALEKEQVKRIEREVSDNVISDAIKKQQEIHAERAQKLKQAEDGLKDKNIYVKVNETLKPQLSPDEQKLVQTFQDQIKANPQEAVKTIEETIKERLGKTISQNILPEEFNVIAKQTAFEITNNLSQNSQPAIKSAVIANLALKPETLDKIQTEGVDPKNLSDWTQALSDQTLSSRNLAQIISISAFGEKFQQAVLPTISVEISTTPQAGYDRQFSLSEIPALYSSNILDNQQSLLSGLKDFGEAEIKHQIFSRAGSFLESQIAKLAPTHPLNVIYNNKIVQAALSRFGLGPSVDWVATNGVGRIAMSMGYGDTFGWLGEITGTSGLFGIAKVASAAKTAKTALTIEQTGGIMASEAFLGGAGGAAAGAVAKTGFKAIVSKITTALSTAIPIPVLNWIIGFIGGEIIGKLIEKIPWDKIKKLIDNFKDFFVAGAFALIGLGLGGTAGALWGGIGGFLGSKAMLSSPTERAAFGRGIGNFFGALGSATLVSIGTPILVTFLVFPVVVALILFIINSGAYVVPPSLSSLNLGGFSSPYVDLTKTANPPGPFTNSDLPETITYTVSIKPKKGNLTNVQLSYDCQVASKTVTKCPDITIEDKYKDVFTKPIDIVSAVGISFTYTAPYDSRFKDSATVDSIKLNAVSASDNASVSTETSASVIFGTPPITCPVLGGHAATPSLNFSLNTSKNTGHGSAAYWRAMDQSPSAYPLPQSTSCHSVSDCSYYGYAYDVFPTGSQEVFAPTVLGKDVTWNCSYAFANPSAGNTYHCISNNGDYMLSLTHMAGGARTGTIKSGEKIGKLFFQPGNTHLHIEFQLNGRYVKPENYFCGGK